jgi:hypothetical protein
MTVIKEFAREGFESTKIARNVERGVQKGTWNEKRVTRSASFVGNANEAGRGAWSL